MSWFHNSLEICCICTQQLTNKKLTLENGMKTRRGAVRLYAWKCKWSVHGEGTISLGNICRKPITMNDCLCISEKTTAGLNAGDFVKLTRKWDFSEFHCCSRVDTNELCDAHTTLHTRRKFERSIDQNVEYVGNYMPLSNYSELRLFNS